MTQARPKILLACDRRVRENYIDQKDEERLKELVDFDWFECDGGSIYDTNQDEETAKALGQRLADVEGLVLCHGSPTISSQLLDQAPKMKIIGELEGDRFSSRIDVEAAWERGIVTVDTTNGSSYPVSEWALALIMITLRNAGAHFRRIINGQKTYPDGRDNDFGFIHGELYGKRVGLIGCGHIGRRLIKFLRGFETEIWVHDPYLAREMADAVGFLKTSLENVLSKCDAIVCLAPHTPRTEGMIGRRELELIPSGAVFVNVSRGKIVDTNALVERLKRGDIVAGIDAFDPEAHEEGYLGHEVSQMENVFMSPHFAGVTRDCYPRFFKLMVDEFERFFGGHETLFDLTPQSLANRRGT